jgi:hypothetical protein
MAVTIIVEDGSIVANANSYDSLANVRAYAEQRGIELPSSDDELGAMVIKAMDYLEALQYQGLKTDAFMQALQWPRQCVEIDETELADDTIPKQLKNALGALVLAVKEGIVLQPNFKPQDYVIEETVGPITTKYANPIEIGIQTRMTAVDSILAPLLKSKAYSLQTNRV